MFDGWDDIIDFGPTINDEKLFYVCTANGFKFVKIDVSPRKVVSIAVAMEPGTYNECSYFEGKEIRAAAEVRPNLFLLAIYGDPVLILFDS